MKEQLTTSMPPPHEDADCHRPLPRYVVKTSMPKDRYRRLRFHAIFVGDYEAAFAEAEHCAAARSAFFFHRYEVVELWCEDGTHQKLDTWFLGQRRPRRVSAGVGMKFNAHPDRKWLAAHSHPIARSPYPPFRTFIGAVDRPGHKPHIGKKQIARGLRQLGAAR